MNTNIEEINETIKNLINRKRGLTNLYRLNNGKINPTNILDLSNRTIRKILWRMLKYENLGCSCCGWNLGLGDIHHIDGRKIPNFNDQKNLSYLCPNCHRLVHQKIINKNKLINLSDFIGDKWKSYYNCSLDNDMNYDETMLNIDKKIYLLRNKKRKIQQQIKHKEKLKELKESNIDFTKFGWLSKESKILNIPTQKVGRWLNQIDEEFYNSCYKKKNSI